MSCLQGFTEQTVADKTSQTKVIEIEEHKSGNNKLVNKTSVVFVVNTHGDIKKKSCK